MFLNIQIDLIILKTDNEQFASTTKKALHITLNVQQYYSAFKWKDTISGFPVSPGSAEVLVRWGGIIK